MKRTATYWPPNSWVDSSGRNVAVQVSAIWAVEAKAGTLEAFLDVDVAEGGYLFNGVTYASDPTILNGARRIAQFLTYPDLRSLKQIRKVILS